MAELGSGNGTGYPAALDTDSVVEDGTLLARADVPNDLAAAIVAIETELGTDPAGSLTDLKTRLAVFLNNNGTAKDPISLDGAVTINDTGADKDFRVKSSGNANCFLLDAGNDNITINAAAVSANYDLGLCGDGVLMLIETTTPTADTNYGKLYCKNDNKLYFQDGAGNEHEIAYG